MADNKADFVLRLIDKITAPARRMANALGGARKATEAVKTVSQETTRAVNKMGFATLRAGDLAGRGAVGLRKYALAAAEARRAQNKLDSGGRMRAANGKFVGPSGLTGRKFARFRSPGTPFAGGPGGGGGGGAGGGAGGGLMAWNKAAGKTIKGWRKDWGEFEETPFGMIAGGIGGVALGIANMAKEAAFAVVKIGALAAGLAALGAITLAKNVVEMGMFAERSKLALTALTGSALKGNAAFEQARRVADELGSDVEAVTDQFIKLRAAQFTLGQSETLIKLSADLQTVTGEADAAERAIRAITQIKAKGRVQTEELLQLSEAGLSLELVFGELSKILGKTPDQIQKSLKTGKIKAADGVEAIQRAIMHKLGEDAPGQIAKKFASSTVSGLLTSLKNLPSKALLKIADLVDIEPLGGVARTVMDAFKEIDNASVAHFVQDMIRDFGKLVDVGLEFARGFGDGFAELRRVMDVDLDSAGIKEFARDAGRGFAKFVTEVLKLTKGFAVLINEWGPKVKRLFDPDVVIGYGLALATLGPIGLMVGEKFVALVKVIRELMGLQEKLAGKPPALPDDSWEGNQAVFPFRSPNAYAEHLKATNKNDVPFNSAFPNVHRLQPQTSQDYYDAPGSRLRAPSQSFSIGQVIVPVVEPGASREEIGRATRDGALAALQAFAEGRNPSLGAAP